MLRLEPRQVAMEAQDHQRDVLGHPLPLHRVDRADDGNMGRQVGRGEQIVGAGAGAGDESERGKARRDSRRELEREQRLDVAGRRDGGVGMDALPGREQRKRSRAVARRTRR